MHSVFLFTLYFVLVNPETRKLSAIYKYEYDGKYHYDNAVGIHFVQSLLTCLSTCSEIKMCMTFFFNQMDNKCILHSDPFTYTNMSESGLGWKFYHTQDRSGRCSNNEDFFYYRELDLCYNLSKPIQLDFAAIIGICKSLGSELIRLDSQEKVDYINRILASIGMFYPHPICIQGTNVIDSANQWTYDDGSLMTYFYWDSSQPNDIGRICIIRRRMYKWWVIKTPTAPYEVTYICENR